MGIGGHGFAVWHHVFVEIQDRFGGMPENLELGTELRKQPGLEGKSEELTSLLIPGMHDLRVCRSGFWLSRCKLPRSPGLETILLVQL